MTIPALSPTMKLTVLAGVLVVLATVFSPLVGQEKPTGKSVTILSKVLAPQHGNVNP